MTTQSDFSEWETVKTFGDGNYFEAGRYRVALLETFRNQGHKGLRGIAEFVVISAEKTETHKDPSPVGSRRSAIFVLDGVNQDSGKGNMKKFVLGLLPANHPAHADGKEFAKFYGSLYQDAQRKANIKQGAESQPARGKILMLDASTASKPTKATANKPPAEQVFVTNLRWTYVAQSKEEFEAERKRLTDAGL